MLRESNKTIKELSKILKISRQGVKYHLNELVKMKLVEKLGIGFAGSDIYKLKVYTKLPVTKRGLSRQYGVTTKNVIDLLNNQTHLISKSFKYYLIFF